MTPDTALFIRLAFTLALVISSEAFFIKWGADTSRQVAAQKQWIQAMQPSMSPAYRYQYAYNPYESRKVYQPSPYMQELGGYGVPQNVAPIPISIPAGASLTPVSLQHVQLVPCMCPVAPEEADKLHEQLGSGPYLAQTYQPPPTTYSVPQQLAVSAGDNAKTTNKQ